MNIVGRSRLASATLSSAHTVTGSAYTTGDSLGQAYEIPYAVGQNGGGLLAHSNLYLYTASATPQIRVHFYANQPSAVTAGAAYAITMGSGYLGYIDHTAWVTAGGQLIHSQQDTPNLVLDNLRNHTRSVWAQLEAQGDFAIGATATGLEHKIGVLQD